MEVAVRKPGRDEAASEVYDPGIRPDMLPHCFRRADGNELSVFHSKALHDRAVVACREYLAVERHEVGVLCDCRAGARRYGEYERCE
jgi:hypothetical protein